MPMSHEPSFSYLLAGLVGFLTIGPVAQSIFGMANGAALLFCLNATLLTGIFSLQESRRLFLTGVVLAVIITMLSIVNALNPSLLLQLWGLAIILVFFVVSITLALTHLFSSGSISLSRITGGVCIYLMLGITWAILYVYLYRYVPGVFMGLPPSDETVVLWDLIYFSFVTMSTLGYGDITPVGSMARTLAYMQAVTGQLYIAILIGAMVGSYVSNQRK